MSRFQVGGCRLLETVTTAAEGRTDKPILAAGEARVGQYELAIHIGDHCAAQEQAHAALFVDRVMPVRFALFDTRQRYHVPIPCAPWSCATCRGS